MRVVIKTDQYYWQILLMTLNWLLSTRHRSLTQTLHYCLQVVINTDQYRGSLAAAAVLRAICAGFAEGRCARLLSGAT